MSVLYNALSEKNQGEYLLDRMKIKIRKRLSLRMLPDIVDWIQSNFMLYDTGTLMTLYDCQTRPLRLAMSLDEKDNFRYSTILWSWPKKSAKSSVIASVVDYIAWNRPYSQIRLFSNDLKQSDSRVGFILRENLKLGTRKNYVHIKPSGYSIDYENGSRVEMVPIDPSGEAGGNDDLIVYSELWGWKSKAHQQMWSEATLSPNKFGRSQRWIDSYAGYTGSSPVLSMIYKTGVEEGEKVFDDLEVYTNDKARIMSTWVTHPMLPWQTSDDGKEYYIEQSSTLLPNEYARMHNNQWVSDTESFIPSEWLDACVQQPLPAYEKNEPWVIALDAAVSGDCFGLIACTRRNGIVIVRQVRKWTPPKGGQIMYFAPPGTPPEQDESPAGELRRLISRHSVVKVVYDVFQLHSFCHQLKDELICYFEEFPQTGKRLLADKALRDDIRERHIIYDGNPDLRDHLLNANAKNEGEADKLRLVKRNDNAKIDLAVCLSMCNYTAVEMNLG